MSLLEQLGADLKPETILIKKSVTMAETFRQQLKVLAGGIESNMNIIFKMMLVHQVDSAIEEHEGILWRTPEGDGTLTGISTENGNWLLSFDVNSLEYDYQYSLEDLETMDILGFMEVCERVMLP